MPKPRLPLTPASSTDIAAMDKSADDLYFSLPPAAIHGAATTAAQEDDGRRRKRQPEFSLPPPPTRTRKIIQVKPKTRQGDDDDAEQAAGSGRKKATAATAAGRKIARRTAHSLIERRRRSKMNQEFATLKDMIPACRGHEMHKLAILQASIEYVNYLESCVKDLKARRDETPTSPAWQPSVPLDGSSSYSVSPDLDPLCSSAIPSPAQSARECSSRASFDIIPMVLPSPALRPTTSTTSTASTRSYSMSTSTTTSPLLVPSSDEVAVQDTDMDREATAALLMLNNDRRHSSNTMPSPTIWPDARRKMGMSVHDLLTH
ncbi:hypothetical protein MferCBS31731_005915 [Microsporum ferrugineum]